MGILNSLFGQDDRASARRQASPVSSRQPGAAPAAGDDAQALARYRYLLRTAPPEAIEQVHTEAFAQLTPAQRAQALRDIGSAVPDHERAALASGHDDPKALARAATRAELREPGFVERVLGGRGGAMGAGAVIGTSLLGSFVGSLAGSMLAQQLMGGFHGLGDVGDAGSPDFDEPQTVRTAEPFAGDYEGDADTQEDTSAYDDPGMGDLDGGDFGGDDFA